MKTSVDLQFANGAYTFKLGLAQIRELQEKTGEGIGQVYARVLAGRGGDTLEDGHPSYGQYYVDDLRETVRQGLIGGGQGYVDGEDVLVTSLRATELVEAYLDTLPLIEQWKLAASVLFATVEGFRDDDAPDVSADENDKKKAGGSTTPQP